MERPPCSDRTDLMFSELVDVAIAVCDGCPYREPCIEGAKRRREPQGVWGGRLFRGGVPVTPGRTGRPPRRGPGQPPIEWTPEMDERLVHGRERGLTWGQLAVSLGCCEKTMRKRYAELQRNDTKSLHTCGDVDKIVECSPASRSAAS